MARSFAIHFDHHTADQALGGAAIVEEPAHGRGQCGNAMCVLTGAVIEGDVIAKDSSVVTQPAP